jgi:peptidyl-dipeptidase A
MTIRIYLGTVVLWFFIAVASHAETPASVPPTAQGAEKLVVDAEKQLDALNRKVNLAEWVRATHITDDTQALSAIFAEQYSALQTQFAIASHAYAKLGLSGDTARKLKLLQNGITIPSPNNDAERAELTRLNIGLDSAYGKGKFCPPEDNGKCYDIGEASKIMAASRNPDELKKIWRGWHAISPPYKKDYVRMVELANKGAKELRYADVGGLWRSTYDMPPDAFATDMERVWLQVKPLYDALYTYTRAQLVKKYGPDVVKPDGLIPAHLLGNMWGQEWENVYDLMAPPNADRGYDLTKILADRKITPKQMVEIGENFFVSLGMPKLPQSFWERSLFTKPQDREVVCHASAWDMDEGKDVRIKMCIEPTEEDFTTIHHELGHDYYYINYGKQSFLFRNGANDGFHEAIGDTIALSVTPGYLKEIGLIDKLPDESADLGLLMHRALEGVAFLPFGYLVDKWRWDVFSGRTSPSDYNKAWWALREKYQGIAPPESRGEEFFDAGAKYHIPGNTPYARYFLARVLQYQFHRALCREAGYSGPLHRCSIYGNKKAGDKLKAMLALGASLPWQVALKGMTGEDKLDATALLDYYAPLKKWLDEQNKGKPARKDS